MRTRVTTSEFGIATFDWPIPNDERLGTYSLEVDDGEINHCYVIGIPSEVRVSRYQLPHFTVSVSTDRAYYLAGEFAKVEVRASYLFGEPLKQGSVKIVRERARAWDYDRQEWATEESDKYEGVADVKGIFATTLDLSSALQELDSEPYDQFQDITYAAYFTDPGSGITEQKRFSIRISRQPIHIYLEGRRPDRTGLPVEMFVSSYYADGRPAECALSASLCLHTDTKECEKGVAHSHFLVAGQTNQTGLARVMVPLPGIDRIGSDSSLLVRAKDGAGVETARAFNLGDSSDSAIRITTPKVIHRPGEPLVIGLESVPNVPLAVVSVYSEDPRRPLDSKRVVFKRGHASASFDYRGAFKGYIALVVRGRTAAGESVHASALVIYPTGDSLSVSAELDKGEYRPGEQVHAKLLLSPLSEAALGINVIDTAVDERARADEDFYPGARISRLPRHDGLRWVRLWGDEVCGVTMDSLNSLNPSLAVPPEIELAAEALMLRNRAEPADEEPVRTDLRGLFAKKFDADVEPIRQALLFDYLDAWRFPKDEPSLSRALARRHLSLAALRDPWGNPYSARFSFEREEAVLRIISAGPDKRPGTGDDIEVLRQRWRYFEPTGFAIDRAISRYHSETGGLVRTKAALARQLKRDGIDFDSLRDPWGSRYEVRFRVQYQDAVLDVLSPGPDRRFEADDDSKSDDVKEWSTSVDYFGLTRKKIDRALQALIKSGGALPRDGSEFDRLLKSNGIGETEMRDPWGRPYSIMIGTRSVYSDRSVLAPQGEEGDRSREHLSTTPVTEHVHLISIRSRGADGILGTGDDVTVARFANVLSHQSAMNPAPVPPQISPVVSDQFGAIAGEVKDRQGAVVQGVSVTATNSETGQAARVVTDWDGLYALPDLQPGLYVLKWEAEGFRTAIEKGVRITVSEVRYLDIALTHSVLGETMTITGTDMQVLGSVASAVAPLPPAAPMQTPRLRKDFPESLFWAPEVHTDASGSATATFKLADNITTWKMSVVASTRDGRIAFLDKPIRVFQPFFIDHDPPPFLTAGDEIALPVVVRNFTESTQHVDLGVKPETWFALKSPAYSKLDIAPGQYGRAEFRFQALTAIDEGPERLTAASADQSDAVEKPITVKPDGREFVDTTGQVFDRSAVFNLETPRDLLPGTDRLRLKVYPNLMSHVLDSVEGAMQRPYGCAEQTISATYPGLLLLSILGDNPEDPRPVVRKARSYLLLGYRQLLGYQEEGGGFSYWGHGHADVALTAYALRFLSDVSRFVEVSDQAVTKAKAWIVKRQNPDGSWPAGSFSGAQDPMRTLSTTAYVAMTLSRLERASREAGAKGQVAADQPEANGASPGATEKKPTAGPGGDKAKTPGEALDAAMKYLGSETGHIDEPYAIAAYALALFDRGDTSEGQKAVARLASLARHESDECYWQLAANTPFYGWGLPGRLEASALAVAALNRGLEATASPAPVDGSAPANDLRGGSQPDLEGIRNVSQCGLLYLLSKKDRYGVWYSTQATVDVLDAIVSAMGSGAGRAAQSGPDARQATALKSRESARVLAVRVNGKDAGQVAVSAKDLYENAVILDLTRFAVPGSNRVELRFESGGSTSTAELISSYYRPWSNSAVPATDRGADRALELSVAYDKTTLRVGEEVTCTVRADRVGWRSEGMLVCEIGLPPGADVDRESLEEALRTSLDRYEVLPDRVLVYVWPTAGGASFQFKFRPRYGINAKTAASSLYDYYNPEAQAVSPPVSFAVQ